MIGRCEMKSREIKMLQYIVDRDFVRMQELQKQFSISKRSVYYDIRRINQEIVPHGRVESGRGGFRYRGSYAHLRPALRGEAHWAYVPEARRNFVLRKILWGEPFTLERLEALMLVSRNTCIAAVNDCKRFLWKKGLELRHTRAYAVLGSERKIRDVFLLLQEEGASLIGRTSPDAAAFDRREKLQLSDYALGVFSAFLDFVRHRVRLGHFVEASPRYMEAERFPYYAAVSRLIGSSSAEEQAYMTAFIASLPSRNASVAEGVLGRTISRLVERFIVKTGVELEFEEEFTRNLKRHLLSSYYRIKFHFPVLNPALPEIKRKQRFLFETMKSILQNNDDFPEFEGMREEEIGFIAAYFGGYIQSSRECGTRGNKVLIVCPNGLTVSKILKMQLIKYIPSIEIVDAVSVRQIERYQGRYDHIVSTVDLPGYESAIVVAPYLTRLDIERLADRFIRISGASVGFNLEKMLEIIRAEARIEDEARLKKRLAAFIYGNEEKRTEEKPMLKDLLFGERIQITERVGDWTEAVRLASAPLLADGSIEPEYVEAMIESVRAHGPYIVLTDYFALPHAESSAGVHRLAMSLLVVREAVSLCGNPVNAFLVLAAVDASTHLNALAEMSELLYDGKNVELLRRGTKAEIIELLRRGDSPGR